MGEIIDLKNISHITLWIDSETAYKVKHYELIKGEKPFVKAVLQRVKPFLHLIDDDWTFIASISSDDTTKVDLDFYTQIQPNEEEE